MLRNVAPRKSHAMELFGNSSLFRKNPDIEGALVRAIEEALSLGQQSKCPGCGVATFKDGGCMHMKCQMEYCQLPWCYGCGRPRRGDSNPCVTCDSKDTDLIISIWNLTETTYFHRRKTLFYLRLVKEAVHPLIWIVFKHKHPFLLQNLESPGLRLTWGEIDNAKMLVLGQTKPDQVRWQSAMEPTIARLKLSQLVESDNYSAKPASGSSRSVEGSSLQMTHAKMDQAKRRQAAALWFGVGIAITFTSIIIMTKSRKSG